MDELPNDAKAFLEAARSVHDAPADPLTKNRLRGAVLHKVAGGAAGGTKLASMSAAKLLAGGALLLALGGASLALRRPAQVPSPQAAREPPAAPATEPSVAVHGASDQGESERAPPADFGKLGSPQNSARVDPAISRPRVGRRHAQESLLMEEAGLLREADLALARHDVAGALAALSEHRRRFPHPTLREERDGLSAIVQCGINATTGTRQAQKFVTRFPASVLLVRVRHACLQAADHTSAQGKSE